MLAKLSEASVTNAKVHRLHKEFYKLARENDDNNTMRLLDMPEIEINQSDLDAIYARIAKTPVKVAMSVYENEFHHVGRICDRITSLEDRMRVEKARYENALKKH